MSESKFPESKPGWYLRHDEVNSMGYFDGKDFTGPTMPATIKVDLGTLARGVALGVVMGTLITGFLFFLLTR